MQRNLFRDTTQNIRTKTKLEKFVFETRQLSAYIANRWVTKVIKTQQTLISIKVGIHWIQTLQHYVIWNRNLPETC